MNLNEKLTEAAYQYDKDASNDQAATAAAQAEEGQPTESQPTPEAKPEKESAANKAWNWTSPEWWLSPGTHWSETGEQAGPRNMKIGGDMETFVSDPKASWEYATAIPSGVADSVIGTYNTFTPGPDIPYLPKYESSGAQFIRDASSLIIPGSAATKALKGMGTVMAARSTGKLGALINSPVARWMGTNTAGLGGGAFADLVAPIQGDPERSDPVGFC